MEEGDQENMKVRKWKMTKPQQEGWSHDGDANDDDDDDDNDDDDDDDELRI